GLVERLDRGVEVGEHGVDVGDDARDDVLRRREAGGRARVRHLLGDALDASVDRKAEGDDALSGLVGPAASVLDERVEELVDADEVGAAYVPVLRLSVDGEGLQAQHDRREELRGARGGGGVRSGGGDGGGHGDPLLSAILSGRVSLASRTKLLSFARGATKASLG